MCKFLLDNGEEKNPKDVNGKTPNDYAFEAEHLTLSYICDLLPETSRAVGRSENPGLPILFGGHNLPPLVEIGLTDVPMAPQAPPGTTGLETIEDQNSKKGEKDEPLFDNGYPGQPQHLDPEFQAKFQHVLLPQVEK